MSLPTNFFIGRGGMSPPDWAELQTGDTYAGGEVLIANNKVMLKFYPSSRKSTGLQSIPSDLTGTFTIPEQVTSIDVWTVGGGAGGTGGNYHGGGGGGGAHVTGLLVTEGENWTYQVGRGGMGGNGGTGNDSNYVGSTSDDLGTDGGITYFRNPAASFSIIANNGTRGNMNSSNSTNPADFGQGGTASISGGANETYTGASFGAGGRGGGRDYGGTNASQLGGGGGGGQPTSNWVARAAGGHGAGRWGGGGGAGSAHDDPTAWSQLRYSGGSPGNATYSFSGGYGGHTGSAGGGSVGQYGGPGGGPAGGYAFLRTDGNVLYGSALTHGSAGGGGFPGGGGGSAVYSGAPQNSGHGADGASGILVIEWPVWA